MKWFDRKFRFETDAALFPNILERLRGTPARIEERLNGIEPDLLIARPPDGSWTIQENVGHLLDLEPLWRGRVDDFLSGAAALREADLSNRRTHEAGHNDRPISEILGEFRRARVALVEALDSVDPAQAGRTALHPRLGQKMRLIDHAVFVAEHDDHHLARITDLLRSEMNFDD